MKKFLKYMFAFCLVAISCVALTACGNKYKGSEKVMSLSVNPAVSFVVDKDNKIASVSYDNPDAGVIYANVNFVGKDVNEVVKLFIDYSVVSGHIDMSGETVTFNVQGTVNADVDALKELVKNQIESTFNKLNVEVTAKFDSTYNDLKQQVKDYANEFTNKQIEDMTIEEMLAYVKEKQEQYAGLAETQVELIKSSAKTQADIILKAVKGAMEIAEEALKNSQENFDNFVTNNPLVSEEMKQMYKQSLDNAKAQYEQAKSELEAKITEYNAWINDQVTNAKQKFEQERTKLIATYKNQVSNYKTTLQTYLDNAKQNGMSDADYNYYIQLSVSLSNNQ